MFLNFSASIINLSVTNIYPLIRALAVDLQLRIVERLRIDWFNKLKIGTSVNSNSNSNSNIYFSTNLDYNGTMRQCCKGYIDKYKKSPEYNPEYDFRTFYFITDTY
jgi:hypothetical protein